MTDVYVVGGRQKPGADTLQKEEWHHYGSALIVSVDLEKGTVGPRVEYASPPDACAGQDDPSILFKTGTLAGTRLYVPTQTEVLVYDVPSFDRIGYLSLPCFNDVHHVCPGPNGTLFVADTGLDMVVEVTLDGKVRREWSVIGEELWTRFSREVDYRKVVTTKPHRSHPNHVFFLDGHVWVTRCFQHDAFCLTREQAPIPVGDTGVHDGLVRDGNVYFTMVSGHVIVVDAATKTVRRRFDLNAIAGRRTPLGWCRGVEVLDDDRVLVGFSRLRPTKWKENVQWVKHRLGGDGSWLMPTRVVMFDLRQEKLCWEVDLEPAGMNIVFSIHAARPPQAQRRGS